MKRFLVSWPVMLLAVFVASCSKEKSVEEDISQYFIKCKIGSVEKTFKYSLTAQKTVVSPTDTSYNFSGQADRDPNNVEGIGFIIRTSSYPLSTGITYKETDPTGDYVLACIYNPNTKDQNKMFSSSLDEANPFQITFTEITATSISGTFSGKLYPLTSSDPNADSAVISNGQFKLKLQ